MAKHKIFLVHGMGDFKKDWSTDIQTLIRELYGSYPLLNTIIAFDDKFEFEPIYYNDTFDKLRKDWAANANAILKELEDGGLAKSVRDMLQKGAVTPAEDKFFTTHVLDVVMYRFIKPVAEEIRNKVATQILGVLDAIPGTKNWSVVAHSLGTSVTHDTLHAMYTHSDPGLPPLTAADTRPQVLMTIANVSRVLETDADAYTSVVRPSLSPNRGICQTFINARHDWDPFLTVKRFAPADDWPSVADRQQFVDVGINAFQRANVHAFDHYLLNPKVHVALFRGLFFNSVIGDAELQDAITRYEAGTPIGAFEDLRQELKSLRPDEEASWKQALESWATFLALVKGMV